MILAFLRFRQQYARVAANVVFCVALAAAGACKPYSGDLEIRAIDCVRSLVEAPADTQAVSAIALLPEGETPVIGKNLSIVMRFLWARHQQGMELGYTLSERYRPEPGHETVVVSVSEAENPLLGQAGSSYSIAVYFELEEGRPGEARVWRIRRLDSVPA